MTPVETLLAVRREGGQVLIRDGRVVIEADGPLPDAVIAALQEHRDRLVQMLVGNEPAPHAVPAAELTEAEAEYEQLGREIDRLDDARLAARARGDHAEAARLGVAIVTLIQGPYDAARERFLAAEGATA